MGEAINAFSVPRMSLNLSFQIEGSFQKIVRKTSCKEHNKFQNEEEERKAKGKQSSSICRLGFFLVTANREENGPDGNRQRESEFAKSTQN